LAKLLRAITFGYRWLRRNLHLKFDVKAVHREPPFKPAEVRLSEQVFDVHIEYRQRQALGALD